MRIKVFKAADLKEAMAMVKDELGSDAVILHTKRYRQGGILGYKSKEIVEVTAAVDDTPRRPRMQMRRRTKTSSAQVTPGPAVQMPVMPKAPRNVLTQYKTAGTEEGVSMARSAELAARMGEAPVEVAFVPMEHATPVLTVPSHADAPVGYEAMQTGAVPRDYIVPQTLPHGRPAPSEILPTNSTQREQATTNLPLASQTVTEASVHSGMEAQNSKQQIQALEDELAQMRKMLKQMMSRPRPEDGVMSLQDALKNQGIGDAVLQDIIRKIPHAVLLAPHDSEEAKKALADYLHATLKLGTGIGLKDGRPKIVALIGTTGVGKTTTIAKIAARFVLEKGISVALITADTYRISAVEQLKTYSDIIGLPLEIVYSAAELKPALRKHRDKKLILIDTAGRSQNNSYQMDELKEFLSADPGIEKHLVMSATTKERDAEAILERFSLCKPDRLLFTKTDETDSLGFIVNLLYDHRIALSYLTNGQSVPDDIEPARPEALAKLLLR